MQTQGVDHAQTRARFRPEARRWAEIEQNIERARDLRSRECKAALLGLFRLLRLPNGLLHSVPRAPLPRTLLAGCAVSLILGMAMDRSAAQEAKIAGLEVPGAEHDRERLAALGITEATIEREENLDALWRAVRELVLPGRVSEATQRRLLRRVWMADPDIRNAPIEESSAY